MQPPRLFSAHIFSIYRQEIGRADCIARLRRDNEKIPASGSPSRSGRKAEGVNERFGLDRAAVRLML